MPSAPLLFDCKGVRKSFGAVPVLKGVDLDLRRGEVLGFLGANGAGKSTLMKIVAGILAPDQGTMTLDGQPHLPANPSQAIHLGIGIVHQELSLVNDLSITDNLFLGRERHRLGIIKGAEQRRLAGQALARVGCSLDPGRRVGSLRTGEKQLVEIARTLLRDCKVLILDEPTAALSPGEAEHLFGLMGELSRQGIGIVYISHRLEEIDRLADRVVVLRDGQVVYNQLRGAFHRKSVVEAMAGEDWVEPRHRHRLGELPPTVPLLRTDRLGRAPVVRNVSVQLMSGSLVALTGLIGSGRTELLRLLAGIDQPDSGQIVFDPSWMAPDQGKPAPTIGFLPEDRKEQGLFLEHPAGWNLSLGVLARLRQQGVGGYRLGTQRGGLSTIPAVAERSLFGRMAEAMRLQPARAEMPAGRFSGGNQQKILLGRILAAEPRLLLLDEPTRGVDVAARSDIYRILKEAACQGAAILFATSEFEEALLLADRILVMREGEISADLVNGPGLTTTDLMHHAVPEGR